MAVNKLDLSLNKTSKIKLLDINSRINLFTLKKDFCLRYKISIKFPPIINSIILRDVEKQFQNHIADAIKNLNYICDYYSYYINFDQL